MSDAHETMKLAQLLDSYTPGDPHSWADEFAWLKENHKGKLALLTLSIIAHGIIDPILLGTDGRIWDGHHRLYVAHRLDIERVPVVHADKTERQT